MSTKNAVYFNDVRDTVLLPSDSSFDPRIQKNDILQINVSSLNPEDVIIYNVSNMTSASGAGGANAGAGAMLGGFLVDEQGFIQYPVLGPVKVTGLTKKALTVYLHDQLIERKLLVDPVVSIRFLNYRVTILGEVNKPTVVNVTNEKISVLEALGMAGDITVFGKRNNILLIREIDGQRIIRRIDLNDKSILNSPYYFLQPNDILYVEPNKSKVATADRSRQVLPIILSSLSLLVIILDRLVINN
ncbi:MULTISPECIES: polysaccharide biosynthesis/export family protein [Chitinophaga]|uniref:polysaccharide biosynthesis/export family protein n=1 Tax=Chitinophaga TaxID=79328 RepID=UPI001D04A991|nr:polysaccharide biosynthesis/export family protein [Chitinophaga ginsengisegetis]MDR6567263.1 polysaccharide export outer membrane protein [Chitinophaga ginsengisegetis]MDR6646993.1 polysaccharide export outer membrane protein [Chitinophaga ginsengisegetis]MDR6653343.1 polysaccharide export outer membrane protein [Chitinophaga ginsengisegetis]